MMHKGRFSLWQRILSAWLCALLVVSGVPRIPAWAEESGITDAGGTNANSKEVFGAASSSAPTDTPDSTDAPGDSDAAASGNRTGEPESAQEPKGEDVPAPHESEESVKPTQEEEEAEEPPSESESKRDATDGDCDPESEAAVESAGNPESAPSSDSSPDSIPDKTAVYASGTLSKTFESDDGDTYVVEVAYGEDACIPEGAELRASLMSNDDAVERDLPQRVERVLGLGADDRVLDATFVDVSIEADGQQVKPAAALEVTICTDAIKPSRAAFVEAVVMGDDSASSDDSAAEMSAALVDEAIVPNNLTPNKADAHATTLSFSASGLGTIALANVATRWDAWAGKAATVSLLVPRHGLAVSMEDIARPELPEGVDLLACGAVRADSDLAYGTSLWLEVQPTDAAQEDERTGGMCAYVFDADDVAGETSTTDAAATASDGSSTDDVACVPGQVVAGPEGTQEPVELLANRDQVLLVWDSGYRNTTLCMDAVTVEGMMPEDAAGTAIDVTKDFAEPTSLVGGLSKKAAKAVSAGTREVDALAAYDITITANGEEYQPDNKHPLRVRIASHALDEAAVRDKDLQLWHVNDGGDIEVIKDFVYADGMVMFEATGFSTYLLVAQGDVGESPVTLSKYFRIKASAKTYARSSTVSFVDTNRNTLMGTVSGTLEVTYTGGGSESNDINTIDVYSFIDKLDPAIIDEYEFSRVYTTLTATNEKDFRYIQVGDGTAIASNGDPNIYRGYFYMDSIAQNAAGQDYYGTWYQLSNGGDMDKVFIEYYHVAPASFCALDTRNDPVEGAVFALYEDPDCYTPFEYKHEEVKATSDKDGLVSFGKIPRGTYYMKETVIPEGYKKSTDIYEVVVDGETTIDNVIHEDDDGSVIISDVLRMVLTKEWDDGADKHKNDSVEVTVYARGHAICDPITLNAKNEWTYTLDGLDPNEPYMVSETAITSSGKDVMNEWIPAITYVERDPHVEYYRETEFKKSKQYVIVTTTTTGTRALVGDSLNTTPLAANDVQITGTVTDRMLWTVDTITKDNVIALKNVASGKYLDRGSNWTLNPQYPVPLYVRHINNEGVIKFYHRPNLNSASAQYLYVHYNGTKEGGVDNYRDDVTKAASFNIYRKVNVRSVDVTISNRTARYPVRIRNVTYPNGTPLSNTTFDLYTEDEYGTSGTGTPNMAGLTAGDDGFLQDGDGANLELSAGTYYLQQTGYAPGYTHLSKAVKFTITRTGALKIAQDDQEVAGFAYVSTYGDGDEALPLLQVPNWISTTFEVAMTVEGKYADMGRGFELAFAMPDGMNRLVGTVDGKEVVLTGDDATVSLLHGQTLRFEDVPATVDYVLTQTRVGQYETQAKADTPDAVTVGVLDGEAYVVTLSDLRGTADSPAHVTITNSLPDRKVFATGEKDNVRIWSTIALAFTIALVAFWLFCRRARA